MRHLVRFTCMLALAGLPLSARAQDGNQGSASAPSAEEPIRDSGGEEGGSRLERWHPEAFVDPAKPASKPTLELELDSSGLEVTPTAPAKQTNPRSKRAGIGAAVVLIVIGVAVGVGVGVSVSKIKKDL